MRTIKQLRENAGLSRKELQELSGLSYTTLWRVENAPHTVVVNDETAEILSRALGVEIEELFSSRQLSQNGRPPKTGCAKNKKLSTNMVTCHECHLATNSGLKNCTNCGAEQK